MSVLQNYYIDIMVILFVLGMSVALMIYLRNKWKIPDDPQVFVDKLTKKHPLQLPEKQEQAQNLLAAIIAFVKHRQDIASDELTEALHQLSQGRTVETTQIFSNLAQQKVAQGKMEQAALFYFHCANLTFLTDIHSSLEEYQQAIKCDPHNTVIWTQFGHIFKYLTRLEEAKMAYEKVFELGGNQRDKIIHAVASYGSLGMLFSKNKELEKAEDIYLKSLRIFQSLDDKAGMAIQYGSLGILYDTNGYLPQAKEMYRQSLDLYSAMNHPHAARIQQLLDRLTSKEIES